MARLNEPPVAPAPALSNGDLDAIKRKFLRTNRELAKINSQQQVHIRQLENDRSRLVAENCSLAQQVLHLQNTLEARPRSPSFSTIDALKNQLETKIQELGGLVAGLGQLKQRGSSAPCNVKTATKKNPEERQWRSALGLQEVENAMLPTITEYKAYPRVTMNAEELQDILDAPDSQSPDIGPPPVSHFDIEEPIAFKHSPSDDVQSDIACDGEEVVLPMNIEPRRKRRESGPRIRRMSLFESPREEPEEKPKEKSEEVPEKPVRTGAKRKFSVQEDDDKSQPQAEPFQFSRRGTPASTDEDNTDGERPLALTRPILSSKPVNTDPMVSPKKKRSSAPEKPEKKKSARPRVTISRNTLPDMIPQEAPDPIATAEVHLESLLPKTPAAESVYFPPSVEPSTSQTESKDTPPPGDLSSMSELGIVSRPSRRARPQVSYKEPSLATKMRRPSKELVDAVVDRRTSVEPPKSAPSSAHVIIKEEPEGSPWKPHGAVVETRGGDGAEMGSPLRQKLDRKEGSQDAKPERPKLNSVAVERAIEKMIEETSTAKRKSLTSSGMLSVKEAAEQTSQEKKESKLSEMTVGPESDMAIFDFNESSPAAGALTRTDLRPNVSLASAARERRRHSSVLVSAPESEDRTEPSARFNGGLPAVHKRAGSGATKTGAPAAGLARSTAAARSSQKEKERKAGTLPSSRSNSRLGSREDGVREGRSERATSRRASMMV
ncbi:uncharacterized protein N0V89_002475 [Didymosphaeria variabile]|uniref:Shugoshin n=1 Tax=Didymosphaeria variabile TaxID=1932322 RepID=A0A9W8XTK3_9PLEO|nr:uncharacterized protein N0V89_002475 [Didymosphaeria variabile]KAJ4357898.1 hypothetical protein N0V89_002475 [Didymosphaeria variabile]